MIYEMKQNLRHEIRRHRKKHHDGVQQSDIDDTIVSSFLSLKIPMTQVIAGYLPVGTELNITGLLGKLLEVGYQLCLPVALGVSQPMQFRQWHIDSPLTNDIAGIPAPGLEATTLIPDVLLIPLLAFDEQGNRLGQGMGYYDTTLAALFAQKTILVIGMAYEVQKVPHVPTHPTDFPMDVIITEQHIYDLNQSKENR